MAHDRGGLRRWSGPALAGLAISSPLIGGADCPNGPVQLQPPIPIQYNFGHSVDLDGDVAAVAAPNQGTSVGGSVFIYRFDSASWAFEAELLGSDAAPTDNFGRSVAIDGDVCVIGAHQSGGYGGAGAAYVFRYDPKSSAWLEEAKLTQRGGEDNDLFGISVSVSGDRIAIAAPGVFNGNETHGAAYVFEREADGSWIESAMIIPDSNGPYGISDFASAVAIDGEVLVVTETDMFQTMAGAAHIYRHDGAAWVADAVLANPEPDLTGFNSEGFGWSAAVHENRIAIPGHSMDGPMEASGAVFVYVRDGADWVLEEKVFPLNGQSRDGFGISVDLDGDLLAVGAETANHATAPRSGSAYVFARQGGKWQQMFELNAPSPHAQEMLGASIAIDGGRVLAGSPWSSNLAILFDLNSPIADCDHNGVPDECDPDCNQNGTSDRCDLNGAGQDANNTQVPDECEAGLIACVCVESAKLAPQELTAVDGFGICVSMSADVALICAPGYDGQGAASYNGGAAFVYRWNGSTWIKETALIPDLQSLGNGEAFGRAGAIDGDYAVVGAYHGRLGGITTGTAYVYKKSSGPWVTQAKLYPSDGGSNDYFGWAVSISSDRIVVGSNSNDAGGANAGAAYVYKRDGEIWSQEAKLVASDAAPNDSFGESVFIDGSRIIVGAPKADTNAPDTGAAYVFHFDGQNWLQETKLTVPNPTSAFAVGYAVELRGDVAIVGDPGFPVAGWNGAGGAHVFRLIDGLWQFEATLTSSDPYWSDSAGGRVAVDGNRALVALRDDSDNGYGSGSAVLFEKGLHGWVLRGKLLASDGSGIDEFSHGLAMSYGRIILGAPRNDATDANSGAAYFFFETNACALGDLNGDGIINVQDLLSLIDAWGLCPPSPASCPADVSGDRSVDVNDLLFVINHWS